MSTRDCDLSPAVRAAVKALRFKRERIHKVLGGLTPERFTSCELAVIRESLSETSEHAIQTIRACGARP